MSHDAEERLQGMCREYLRRLRYLARKHGLGTFVDETIELNRQKRCKATRHEVEMLSRCVDEERVSRKDVPELLGKSYRQCIDDGDFRRIRRLSKSGIYSKLSTIVDTKH